MSIGTKAERAVRLLLGLRNPRIAKSLAAYGFTENDMREGWGLLQALGKTRFEEVEVPTDVQAIQALDTWENTWFPIASATLGRYYPAAQARLFLNLSQTEGPEVAVSVHTFLDRLDAMAKGESAYGPEGIKAAEVLGKRGMTPAVIAEARNLLAVLGTVAGPIVPFSVEEQKAELAKDEAALWGWYLDWSQVARIAIKQRGLLRQLGFLGDRAEAETEPEPEPTNPSVPVPGIAVSGTVVRSAN